MTYKLAGIKRKADFSPNHVENDTLLLLKVKTELERNGAEVRIYDEKGLEKDTISETIIFSMAQGLRAGKLLDDLSRDGKFIINHPKSVLNCHRSNFLTTLKANNIPVPKSIIVDVKDPEAIPFSEVGSKKIWIKRGDVHAIHREDVTLCYSEEEKNFILKEFRRRKIKTAILQEHVKGDVIKFYSVKNTDFFYWYYLNGEFHTEFNTEELRAAADTAAGLLDIEVYGGDAVIREDGSIVFIDLNDWPSFAPVRDQASKYIARLILNKAEMFLQSSTYIK